MASQPDPKPLALVGAIYALFDERGATEMERLAALKMTELLVQHGPYGHAGRDRAAPDPIPAVTTSGGTRPARTPFDFLNEFDARLDRARTWVHDALTAAPR